MVESRFDAIDYLSKIEFEFNPEAEKMIESEQVYGVQVSLDNGKSFSHLD